MNHEKVSILMLTHNAPEYVEIAIRSVNQLTTGVEYELVVVDNASQNATRELLERLRSEGLIDTLFMSESNTLFAGGNNIAADLASVDATHFVLLNSDVEVRDELWLRRLLDRHEEGATAYGVALEPLRIDGYCLLIDADLYRRYPLDEGHQWWWSVTKQQALLLKNGYRVAGFGQHENYLHHFGGKSGNAFASAKGMDVSRREVYRWFGSRKPDILDRMDNGFIPGHGRELGRVSSSVRYSRARAVRVGNRALSALRARRSPRGGAPS